MKKQVYYIDALSLFKGEERSVIDDYYQDENNGYAELCTIYGETDNDLETLLIKHGYSVGDQVLVHIKW